MFYPVTTQQSGVAGACGAERSQTLVKSLVRTAFRGEPGLFRSPRPDFIAHAHRRGESRAHRRDCSGLQDRTSLHRPYARLQEPALRRDCSGLQDRTSLHGLRSARPDRLRHRDCSGLQDRTSLRQSVDTALHSGKGLFRSPRPDFIETLFSTLSVIFTPWDCSGLQDRTSLRGVLPGGGGATPLVGDCSGLQDRTSLRQVTPMP